MTNTDKAYMAILAIVIVLVITLQNVILENKLDMLIEINEVNMIEYCIDINGETNDYK